MLHHAVASASAGSELNVGSTAETVRVPGAGEDCATFKSVTGRVKGCSRFVATYVTGRSMGILDSSESM